MSCDLVGGGGRDGEEDLFLGMRWTFCSSSMAVTLPKCSVRSGERRGKFLVCISRVSIAGNQMMY